MDSSTSRLNATPSSASHQRVARKRNRVPISCNHCRFRKLKCSRAKPCESCIKSGDAATCSYVAQESRDNSEVNSKTRNALESRIDRLEALLKSAMVHNFRNPSTDTERSSSSPQTLDSDHTSHMSADSAKALEDQEVNNISGSFGVMKIDQDQTTHYLGGGHWVSIISEIDEFRNYLATNYNDPERDGRETQTSSHKPDDGVPSLLRGTYPPATQEHLLSLVPPRTVTDQLIQLFFHSHLASSHFIHETTFMKSYHEFWNDPSKTKITWLGMFFAMLNVAEISYKLVDDVYSADQSLIYWYPEGGHYREGAIKCLIASDYTKPSTYTIETLMLYIEAEWVSSQDASIELSAVLAMTIRLAMGMGIHRDSKRHPLSVFQAEMRRRLWASLITKDILYSMQLSLPNTIRRSDWDCGLPRNLRDIDFDESSTELPPPRDLSETTEISYIIAKYRRSLMVAEVSELVESGKPLDHDQIREYRKALEDIFESTPPHLKLAPPEKMSANPRYLTQQQKSLDRFQQLAKCILHRKFLAPAHRNPTPQLLEYRRSCIDAAMTLLSHQVWLYQEYNTYPEKIRKRHIVGLTSHDFYTADMAVALDLHFGLEGGSSPTNSSDISIWGYDKRLEMINLLETSNEYWGMAKDTSHDAAKAFGIFSYILRKVKTALGMNDIQTAIKFDSGNGVGGNGMSGTEETGANADWMFPIEGDQMMLDFDFDWNLWDEHRGEGVGFGDIAYGVS